LGFLQIGQEIENPFNYDLNDLNLDDFCENIVLELAQVTAHPALNREHFVLPVDHWQTHANDKEKNESSEPLYCPGKWIRPFDPERGQTVDEILVDKQYIPSHEPALRRAQVASFRKFSAELDAKRKMRRKKRSGSGSSRRVAAGEKQAPKRSKSTSDAEESKVGEVPPDFPRSKST